MNDQVVNAETAADDTAANSRPGPQPVQQVSMRIGQTLANEFRRVAGTGYGDQRAALEEALRDYISKHTAGREASTLTVDPDVLEDAKDGYALSQGQHRTFAEYLTAAVAAYNQEMRQQHTDGKAFPPRPTWTQLS